MICSPTLSPHHHICENLHLHLHNLVLLTETSSRKPPPRADEVEEEEHRAMLIKTRVNMGTYTLQLKN
jgi:hypothetical protein